MLKGFGRAGAGVRNFAYPNDFSYGAYTHYPLNLTELAVKIIQRPDKFTELYRAVEITHNILCLSNVSLNLFN